MTEPRLELALHELFSRGKLTHQTRVIVQQAVKWRPWWPSLECIANALRKGKPADWPDFPERERKIADATAALKPYFDAWKAR